MHHVILFGYYAHSQLWRHVRRCPLTGERSSSIAQNTLKTNRGKGIKVARAADQILAPKTSDEASDVLSGMRKGKVYMAFSSATTNTKPAKNGR